MENWGVNICKGSRGGVPGDLASNTMGTQPAQEGQRWGDGAIYSSIWASEGLFGAPVPYIKFTEIVENYKISSHRVSSPLTWPLPSWKNASRTSPSKTGVWTYHQSDDLANMSFSGSCFCMVGWTFPWCTPSLWQLQLTSTFWSHSLDDSTSLLPSKGLPPKKRR